MGTTWLLTANALQAFGIKTILGSFIVILFILAIHASQKHTHRSAMVAFLVIVGITVIGSLIMFSLALDSIANNPLGSST